jgi:hypothetical protein
LKEYHISGENVKVANEKRKGMPKRLHIPKEMRSVKLCLLIKAARQEPDKYQHRVSGVDEKGGTEAPPQS